MPRLLPEETGVKTRNRASKLSMSEVITILILFHSESYRNLKHFYLFYVCKRMQEYFPNTVSYNRFVELQQKSMLALIVFVKTQCLGKCSGISFIDSTKIAVCNNKRIRCKVFKDVAEVGKSTMGWFYGFKLHIIINDKGELLNFVITPENTEDREPIKNEKFLTRIFGKLFADKGYIGRELFETLFINGIQLITSLRKNMKGAIMSYADKILLRKRSVIETVNDELKNICQIEHSRHRSVANFIANILAALACYSFFPKKSSIKVEFQEPTQQLTIFP